MPTAYLWNKSLPRAEKKMDSEEHDHRLALEVRAFTESESCRALLTQLAQPNQDLRQRINLVLEFLEGIPPLQRPGVALELYRRTQGHGAVREATELVLHHHM